MPFRALSPKEKSRVVFRIRGPRTKNEQKTFKKALNTLLKKNRAKLVSVPKGGG